MSYLASNSGGVLLEIKEMINTFISEQLDQVFEVSSQVGETFKYIALAGVVVKIFMNFRDNPTYVWGYLSYIPLTFFLFNYDAVVQGVFDLTSKADQYSSSVEAMKISSSFFSGVQNNKELSEVSFWDMSVSYILHELKMVFLEGIVYIFLIIGLIVSALIYVYLKLKILLKLMVLTFFGPLNISLSFVPGFEGNWKGWLMKVIEVCLYIPVLYLIDYLGMQLLQKVFQPQIVTDASGAVSSLLNSILGVIFYAILIFSYLSIDNIVAFGINSGTSAIGAGKKVSAVAMMAARKALMGI